MRLWASGKWFGKGLDLVMITRTIPVTIQCIISKPDGILEVSNDVEGVGYSTGDYSYEFVSDPYNSGVAEVRGLKISGSLPWGYQIEATTMMLDLSFLDGPLKYFIRIE